MNNSVIILGINNYTKDKYFNDSDISFIFKNINHTKYFGLHYTINDLSKLNLTINLTEKDYNIGFTKNIFKSGYNNESNVTIEEEDEHNFFNSQTKKICSINSDTYRFFHFRDTSFKIPKVYISLFILHPFLRPNRTESENHNLFFQLILFISYLKDEINYRLVDAIRAGNEFKIDFTENFIYIDIFCFSDIAKKILEIIEEIISNMNIKIENNYEIYRDYALETLNLKGNSNDNKLKLEFYAKIYDDLPVYNFYEFPIDEFKNKTVSFHETFNSFIMQVYIYGFISEDESKEICNIFKKSNIKTFSDTLETANLNNGNVSIINFVEKLMNKNTIELNKTNYNYHDEINNKIYFYKRMSKYNYRSSVFSYIIQDIYDDIDSDINVKIMTQKHIYLKIVCKNQAECNKSNILDKVITQIDNSSLNKKVDFIGNRFYYYLKNTQNFISNKHENFKTASLHKTYENLYERFNDSENKEIFDIDFETFKKNISDLNQIFPNYYEFK